MKDEIKKAIKEAKDDSKSFSKKDIESGKLLSILSYLEVLVLIPFFVEKENKYVQYHAKQGLNLFIMEIVVSIAVYIVNVLVPMFLVVKIVNLVKWVFILGFSLLGIINVLNGEAKELPVIGKIKIIK